MSIPKLSIVIPVYKGETTLEPLMVRIYNALHGQYNFQIILVDDSGTARNKNTIEDLKGKYGDGLIKSMILSENTGQQNAIIAGFKLADGDLFVTMDDDMQHPPEHIPEMVARMSSEDYDVVYAYFSELSNGWFRNMIGHFSRSLNRVLFPSLYKNYSPFRMIKRDVALKAADSIGSGNFLDVVLPLVSQKTGHTTCVHGKSIRGRSSYTLKSLAKLSWQLYFSRKDK